MSKVGILSMQRIKNYGSFLQAYGLKKIVEQLGNEVEFVDYHIEEPIIKNNESSGIKRKINKGLEVFKYNAKLKHKLQYIRYKQEFDKKYFKYLNITNEYNYNPILDTLIIGSDEVFNCIQSNSNVGYSLELFGKNNNAKKVITYAASFGNTTLEKLEQYGKNQEIKEKLENIDSISVRDENSKHIVETLTNKKCIKNIDPVLAYDYMNECKEIPELDIKEKYIIVYAYNGRISKDENKVIKSLAEKNKLKIYSIGGAQSCADKFIECSPFEVLAYFKNAEFVITDTFHGTIFSIINHKPFATLVRKSIENKYGNEEKLTDLLNTLDLKDRIIYDINNAEKVINKNCDYNNVEKILKNERKRSIEYLKENIFDNEKKNHIINNKYNCCACSACLNICPKNAIIMEENELGFKYPKIDETKCINCGLCKKACHYKKEKSYLKQPIKSYAAVEKNKNLLLNSASGGVFAEIAQNILKNNGIVYGCSMNLKENNSIKHIRISELEELSKLQGSKYVQSDIANTYKQTKEDLENGKIVLFSGTPCQIDGLYGYLLGKEYKNLYTIDIICHGTPNQKMFKDFIEFLENKNDVKIIDFKFRAKKKEKSLLSYITYITKNGNKCSKFIPAFNLSYYQLFLDGKTYRDNCYSCPYATSKRIGNITIGDFWGIKEEHPNEIDSKNGVSCIIVNDERGKKLLKKYNKDLITIDSEFKKIARHNKQLNVPSKLDDERSKLMNIYREEGYKEIDKYYFKKNKLKNSLKKIKNFIKIIR